MEDGILTDTLQRSSHNVTPTPSASDVTSQQSSLARRSEREEEREKRAVDLQVADYENNEQRTE